MQVSSLVTTKWLLLCQVDENRPSSPLRIWTTPDYIAATNRSAALDIIERIERLSLLCALLQAWADWRVSGTRELVVTRTPFVVPYRVEEDRIEILAVIHAARRWPGSFQE